MQASQSTSAEGKRSFSSPFTAPIQAARRLMERQQQADHSEDDLPVSNGISGGERSDGLTGAWGGQLRYDEASIVARLDAGLEAAESEAFEEDIDPTQDFAITDGAYGKIDQPCFKSPFVSLGLGSQGSKGPDLHWNRGPDPLAVRAAITRIARESQSKESGAAKNAIGSEKAVAFADAVAFEDVARRVWRGTDAEDLQSHFKENTSLSGNPTADTAPSVHLAAPIEVSAAAAPAATLADTVVTGDASARPADADISGLDAPEEAKIVGASQASAHGIVSQTALGDTAPSTEDGECLAHDAGNLLSAMRLYSELLCISGVLQERHRHYANDLKLLATRSQKLIDRLLKLGEQLGEAKAVDLAAGQAGAQTGGRVEGRNTELTRELHEQALEDASKKDEAPKNLFDTPNGIQTYVPGSATELEFKTEETGTESAICRAAENRPEGTNVAAALERMGNLLHTISHGALRIDLGRDAVLPVPIEVEPLERILVNLVCNATAAVKGGGAIRVRAGVQDRSGDSGEEKPEILILTVDDTGCGMTAAQIHAALGERDALSIEANIVSHEEASPLANGRTHRDHDRKKPAVMGRRGLGLRIVRDLVAASGGKLFIQSQPGTGTRIEIHWQTLSQPESLLHAAPDSSILPLPADPAAFHPLLARKPVGVSRIRAGSVREDGGMVAC